MSKNSQFPVPDQNKPSEVGAADVMQWLLSRTPEHRNDIDYTRGALRGIIGYVGVLLAKHNLNLGEASSLIHGVTTTIMVQVLEVKAEIDAAAKDKG